MDIMHVHTPKGCPPLISQYGSLGDFLHVGDGATRPIIRYVMGCAKHWYIIRFDKHAEEGVRRWAMGSKRHLLKQFNCCLVLT